MLGRTVGIVAASALTAQAFLIPAGLDTAEGDASIWTPIVDTRSQAIKLSCPECVFSAPAEEKAESDSTDDTLWIQGGANSLKLNFSVSEDGHSMGMDSYQLYPMTMRHFEKPSVHQIASSADVNDLSVTAAPVTVTGETTFIEEDRNTREGDSLVYVTYQMLQVEHQPISVDGARVTMLKDAEGTLSILSIDAVPKVRTIFDGLPGSPGMADVPAPPAEPSNDCANLPAFVCEWKKLVSSKLDGVKASMPKIKGGCKGKGMRLPGHIKPHFPQLDAEGKPVFPDGHPHDMRPHHGGPHAHHHHGHHHRHHFWHRFLRGVVMVLVPVMAGMTMGMTVGLVGMLMGRLVSYMWIKFVRGGRRGYASVAQQETAEDFEGDEAVYEKYEVVVEDAEPLPRYEEAPAYEETEQK